MNGGIVSCFPQSSFFSSLSSLYHVSPGLLSSPLLHHCIMFPPVFFLLLFFIIVSCFPRSSFFSSSSSLYHVSPGLLSSPLSSSDISDILVLPFKNIHIPHIHKYPLIFSSIQLHNVLYYIVMYYLLECIMYCTIL